MGSFEVKFKRSAEKDLRRLPKQLITRVIAQIEALTENPFPHQAVKLTDTERLYRIRVGEYRVIYEVDSKAHKVIVHYIRHRRDAYRT